MHAEIFRTNAVAPSGRLRFWNDIAAQTFGDISVNPLPGAFSAQLRRLDLGGVKLAGVSSTAARIEGASTRRTDGWFLLLNERGACRMAQQRREVCLLPGELTALRSDEPYRIEFSGPNKTIVLHLPNDPRRLDLDCQVAKKHDALEATLIVALMRRLDSLDSCAVSARCLERLALDIAAVCWPVQARFPQRQSMAAWQRSLPQYAADNLGDPGLSAASIARHFGISARYVHLVFARQGTTAARFILERRLSAAATALAANPAERISDIAFRTGFSDLSHFCRTFRRRFGTSARNYRGR